MRKVKSEAVCPWQDDVTSLSGSHDYDFRQTCSRSLVPHWKLVFAPSAGWQWQHLFNDWESKTHSISLFTIVKVISWKHISQWAPNSYPDTWRWHRTRDRSCCSENFRRCRGPDCLGASGRDPGQEPWRHDGDPPGRHRQRQQAQDRAQVTADDAGRQRI